ncbi:VOC family protein [Candidatus Bathyarchaeota archaeon]|nr:MAG: VOC family protein [Candidatus Bathyarchaeota archaeon]
MNSIEGMITFTYYKDIEKAVEFYGEKLGFKMVMGREWVKIFKVGQDSHIGLVDSEKGYLKPQEEKPVMLSVFVENVDEWYKMLTEKGVKTNHPPQKSGDIDMRGFLTWDPEGYVIEFLTFDTKPYGE